MTNFNKLTLAVAVSALSFNVSAKDWASTDFDSLAEIAANVKDVYGEMGGDIGDYTADGKGADELATLMLEISDFSAAVAPVIEIDDNNELIITEGSDGVGSIESINEQVAVTMSAIDKDLFGTKDFAIKGDSSSNITDANAGLSKSILTTIDTKLKDVVDNADRATDDKAVSLEEALDYFESDGGVQDEIDKFNDARDGVNSLAVGLKSSYDASDDSFADATFSDHASLANYDAAVEAASITSDVEIVTIADRGFSYGSYSDLVQGAAELDYQASAQAFGDESVTLVEGMAGSGDDTSALFVMSNFGSTGGSLSFSIGTSVDGFQLTADLTFNGVTLAKADYDEYATMDELYQDIMEALLEADQG